MKRTSITLMLVFAICTHIFTTSDAAATALKTEKKIMKTMRDGSTVEVLYRKGLLPEDQKARGFPLKQETLLLKAGTIRREGAMPLKCDILFERDVPITLRDGTVIYVDIFRPNDDKQHPAIMAWSPYGKEIGGQHLDDVEGRSGVPFNATSGLEKFEAPDPAYWVGQGYVIINPDSRGANNSNGDLNYWGTENSLDGYDTIEWAAAQPWSNGKIGMSGNSWLTVSQWFIAGERPPHLTAIAPWEGFYDHFRETANRGGIPNPAFPEAIFETFASRNWIEDQPRMVVTHTLLDSYWEDKIAKIESIDIPAYVVASYTNPVHTHGTFEAFRKISSKEKWLRVHDTGEWFDYYQPENVEDLRKFFDHYLKGIDNGWEKTPYVRLSVLDPGHENIVNRVESDFPLERTEYGKLYLSNCITGNSNRSADNESNSNRSGVKCADSRLLSLKPEEKHSIISYDVESENSSVCFLFPFEQDTEITGYMRLHLYVEAQGADDMDLSVTVEKVDNNGKQLTDTKTGQVIQSTGLLRVSHRALDEKLSTPFDPHLCSDKEELLHPGQIVPVDIAIWPMGMIYHKGEALKLTISAWEYHNVGTMGFGSAEISVPKEGYTFTPGTETEMVTVGGYKGNLKTEINSPSRNKGTHIFHIGGEYESYLVIPVVPVKN
ncbi:MAG: CocE/NonD family hydrolase [Synergistaceae bacterium]|nr:CocE/NonD family hydrolase [Synergistaceae bacterium]